jgi:hypothetical protein
VSGDRAGEGFRNQRSTAIGNTRTSALLSRHSSLDRFVARLTAADADDGLDIGHEHLAITPTARVRAAQERLHECIHLGIAAKDLELDLGSEIDGVVGGVVRIALVLLASETVSP